MKALSLALVVALACVHVFSPKLRVLESVPRSRLLSAAGGMAVAFVLLRLLPAIAEYQSVIAGAAAGTVLSALRNHVYVVVLVSLAIFYGLERLAKQSRAESVKARGPDRSADWVFWLHIGTFALMNVLVGYLIHEHSGRSTSFLLLFFLAMLFKFLVNDHGLHQDHKANYDGIGRWLLAGAVGLGWLSNLATDLPRVAPALLQAFLAGGVLLNVLKEEIPAERKSSYSAFIGGAAAYSVLLLSF